MRVEEFERKVSDRGFRAFFRKDKVVIADQHGVYLLEISEEEEFYVEIHEMFRGIHYYNRKKLYEIATEYAATPLDERREPKKYIYEFGHNVTVDDLDNYGKEINKPYYLDRHKDGEKSLMLDSSGKTWALRCPTFHFTDEDVEQYTGKERALFDACEKIEVPQ